MTEGSTRRPNFTLLRAVAQQCDPERKAAALSNPRQGMRVREPGRGIAAHTSPGPQSEAIYLIRTKRKKPPAGG